MEKSKTRLENDTLKCTKQTGDTDMFPYRVPFAYEMYGYIPVSAKNRKEAVEKAQEALEKMDASQMAELAAYLLDSEEIDYDGDIKEGM